MNEPVVIFMSKICISDRGIKKQKEEKYFFISKWGAKMKNKLNPPFF